MTQRRDERFEFFGKVFWNFFAQGADKRSGYLGNISNSGCLLKTTEAIENRRWIRLIIEDKSNHLYFVAVGRVVRRQNFLEILNAGTDFTLYQHGIEFTYPNYFSCAATDLILALSRRNLMVRSCLSLNSKSSLRPEFLA